MQHSVASTASSWVRTLTAAAPGKRGALPLSGSPISSARISSLFRFADFKCHLKSAPLRRPLPQGPSLISAGSAGGMRRVGHLRALEAEGRRSLEFVDFHPLRRRLAPMAGRGAGPGSAAVPLFDAGTGAGTWRATGSGPTRQRSATRVGRLHQQPRAASWL